MVAGLAVALGTPASAQTAPAGEAVMAWHVTIAPTWFDPSTAPPQITPFGILYALHDGPVRPLPGQKIGASLAESWTRVPTAWCTSSSFAAASSSTTAIPSPPRT